MSDDKKKIPAAIRTFNFHGADMREPSDDSGNWSGDCVLCGKEKHFFADEEEGKWDCKVCGESGNVISFLGKIHAKYEGFAEAEHWEKLSKHRGIPAKYLKRRGLVWTGDNWMIPCYSETGSIRDLRCYDYKQLISTAGCKVQLFGMRELAKSKPGCKVWICEGEWDAIAMDWLLASVGKTDDVVVGVPGSGTFKDEWIKRFAARKITACYDNDQAGDAGAEKCHKILRPSVKSLDFVSWPRSKPKGYDLRDYLKDALPNTDGVEVMKELMALVDKVPRTIKEKGSPDNEKEKALDADLKPIDLIELLKTFDSTLHLTGDMICALKVMLACALSTDMPGDPLWMFVVGAASAGKTQLLSGFAGSSRCIFLSNVSSHALVSGFRGEGGEDPSILAKANDKTLVFKDFTEILSKPQVIRDEMFGLLRGGYDGSVTRMFGNGVTRDYQDLHFTIISGVTHMIHAFNNTSLGERFLKFQFKNATAEHVDNVLNSAIGNVGKERQIEDALKKAVGAFLVSKLDMDKVPNVPAKYIDRLKALVQLIAQVRSTVERDRYTQEIAFRPVAEAGTRLAKQLVKLAMMIAVVEGKTEVDNETYDLVERVGFDTAYGFHLDIVDALMSLGGEATRSEAGGFIRMPLSTLHRRFDDLIVMNVLERSDTERKPPPEGGKPPAVYKVNQLISGLWFKAKGKPCPTSIKSQPRSTATATPTTPATPTASGTKKLVLRSSKSKSGLHAERLF